jgi:RNA polymerase sigma-70 factor (ECF subfamily)
MVDNNAGATPDDGELIEKAKKGDEHAFELLVKKYQKGIYRLTYRMTNDHFTADELALETFVRAYKALPRFKKGANFFNWIYTIGMRLSLNYLKKEKRMVDGDPEVMNAMAQRDRHNDDMLDRVIAKETASKIREAIERLPEKLRMVLLLRIDEEMSYSEIAEALKVPTGTVMSRLNRAREQLKQSLGNYLVMKNEP